VQLDLWKANACAGSQCSCQPQQCACKGHAKAMEIVKAITHSLACLILFSFSWGRFRKITLKVFPVLNWLFSYRFREWILRDLHAGLSVGMFQIPQGRQREKKRSSFLLYIMLFMLCLLLVFLFFLMLSGYVGTLTLEVP